MPLALIIRCLKGCKLKWLNLTSRLILSICQYRRNWKVDVLILRCAFSKALQLPPSPSGSSQPSSSLSPAPVSTPQTSSSGSCWPPPASSTHWPPLTKPVRIKQWWMQQKTIICPACEQLGWKLRLQFWSASSCFVSYYYSHNQRFNQCSVLPHRALGTNLCWALYLCHPLLQQKQVKVSEHFARRERPLQCVVVPLNHR